MKYSLSQYSFPRSFNLVQVFPICALLISVFNPVVGSSNVKVSIRRVNPACIVSCCFLQEFREDFKFVALFLIILEFAFRILK